jgi:hypothetical protein
MITAFVFTATLLSAADTVGASDLSFGRVTVIGVLGKPLGSRLVLTGRKGERTMSPNTMAVLEVDGRPASADTVIEIRGLPVKAGVRYTLEGYEAGEFAGPASWHQPGAQGIFGYRPFFVVTKVVKEQALEARVRRPSIRFEVRQ